MKGFILLFIMFPLLALSQNEPVRTITVGYEQLTGNWTEISSVDGVMFYAKKVDCNRPENGIFQEMTLIKVVNTTPYNVTVSWDLLQWLDDTLWTRLPVRPENRKLIHLEEGSSLEGSCDKDSDYYSSLTVFCRFLNYDDKPELTKFELSNIIITPYEK